MGSGTSKAEYDIVHSLSIKMASGSRRLALGYLVAEDPEELNLKDERVTSSNLCAGTPFVAIREAGMDVELPPATLGERACRAVSRAGCTHVAFAVSVSPPMSHSVWRPPDSALPHQCRHRTKPPQDLGYGREAGMEGMGGEDGREVGDGREVRMEGMGGDCGREVGMEGRRGWKGWEEGVEGRRGWKGREGSGDGREARKKGR